ncbi:MAG: c-type cytochrome [Betaproteobacteria bacterium]|nr:c-type cytochrome [Betaproteobacteria bacterium]
MSDPGTDPREARIEAVPLTPGAKGGWRRVKGPGIFALAGLAAIWVLLPMVSDSWGIRFGAPYRVFFSLAVLGSALFFILLNWGPIPAPGSPLTTFASIFLVYGATVGGVMSFGLWYYPQFEIPKPAVEQARAQERGKQAFLSPAANCFACHSIEALGIRGGTRGPDLSAVGAQAEARKSGTPAEDYIRESIVNPAACLTPLPASGLAECLPAADPARTYPPLMPPGFKDRLSDEQINDLVTFLMGLKGLAEQDGKSR